MTRQPRPPTCTGCIYALLALAPCIYATPTIPLERRGGGTNPVTDDPATIPTSPPTSNYQNGVPKIAGSEGGFIGLIVGLGVLVIVAGLGIWFLLRRRRQHREKRRSDTGTPSGLGAAYDAKTSFPKPGSRGLFGGKNTKKGWVRTAGDGFVGDDREGIELAGGRKGQGPYLASDTTGAFSSASTIRLAPPEMYKDPYSPQASREELVSPVGQPSSVFPGERDEEGKKGEYEHVEDGKDGEGDSPTSRMSERSGRFAGGTRFRESL